SSRVAAEGTWVVHLRDEGVARDVVPLAALPDGFHPCGLVFRAVLQAQLLRCAVDHYVHVADEVLQRADDRDTGRLQAVARTGRRGVDRISALDGGADAVVGDDVANAHEGHVVLQGDGVRYALSDHAIAVHGHTDSQRS